MKKIVDKLTLLLMIVTMTMSLAACGLKDDAEDILGPASYEAEKAPQETSNVFDESSVTESEGYAGISELSLGYDDALFSLRKLYPEKGAVVCAGRYDDENILILTEEISGSVLTSVVSLINPFRGTCKKKLEFTEEVSASYHISNYNYVVYSYSPLILYDWNNNTLKVFNEDLSGFDTFIHEEGVHEDISCYVYGNFLYFMEIYSCKMYKLDLSLLDGGNTYRQDWLSENGTLVYEPDVFTGSCIFSGLSDDGKYALINAFVSTEDDYLNIVYNLETMETERMFNAEVPEDEYHTWSSWDYKHILRNISENSYELKYSYECWDTGVSHPVLIDKKAVGDGVSEEIYLECAMEYGLFGEYMVFVAHDYNSGTLCDILLWNYSKSQQPLEGKQLQIHEYSVPVEIDYGIITQRATEIEEKYGVNIILGENVPAQISEYLITADLDTDLLLPVLDEVERALDTFPDGLFEELIANQLNGVNIYLCDDFTNIDPYAVVDAAGFAASSFGTAQVCIDVNQYGIYQITVHELVHIIDDRMIGMGLYQAFDNDWMALNPADFKYNVEYTDYTTDYGYTFYDYLYTGNMLLDDVYFYTTYGKTTRAEDLATTMEYFLAGDEYDYAYDSIHLREKILLFWKYCEENYESFRTDSDFLLKDRYMEMLSRE